MASRSRRWLPRPSWSTSPLGAALVYAALSVVWIVFSDSAVAIFIPDRGMAQELSILKGLGFVLLTALLVYWLVRNSVRAAEATLLAEQASERQFRDLLERVDLLAVIFDGSGTITFCNDAVVKATGWTRQEVLGRSYGDLLGDEAGSAGGGSQTSAVREPLEALRHRPEQGLRTKGGERRTVRWAATELRGPNQALIGGAAVGEDVTDRQRFDAELRQVQKMEALGRLAGSVAHDFNNLLTAIRGYADLVLTELEPDSRLREDAAEIRRAADRASALTAQLLAFSRRQASAIVGPLDLGQLARGIEPMLRRLMGEQVDLRVVTASDCWVVADQGQLEQVALNLAVNARDAMPAGGILTMEVAPAEPGLVAAREMLGGKAGPHVLLTVSDTGDGIPPEVMPHLFEPFFTTKPRGRGTGLGLATVYSAVATAGGQIWAESDPGHGSCFVVLLPRVAASPVSDQPGAAAPAHGRGTERVLVAEDDAAVRSLVRTVLEREGYSVIEASNGEEALAMSDGNPIDLLVSDLVMPGLGGRELVARLRDRRPDLRVLFMSGYDERDVEAQDADLADPLLIKPFSAGELGTAVRELLDSRTAG